MRGDGCEDEEGGEESVGTEEGHGPQKPSYRAALGQIRADCVQTTRNRVNHHADGADGGGKGSAPSVGST